MGRFDSVLPNEPSRTAGKRKQYDSGYRAVAFERSGTHAAAARRAFAHLPRAPSRALAAWERQSQSGMCSAPRRSSPRCFRTAAVPIRRWSTAPWRPSAASWTMKRSSGGQVRAGPRALARAQKARSEVMRLHASAGVARASSPVGRQVCAAGLVSLTQLRACRIRVRRTADRPCTLGVKKATATAPPTAPTPRHPRTHPCPREQRQRDVEIIAQTG